MSAIARFWPGFLLLGIGWLVFGAGVLFFCALQAAACHPGPGAWVFWLLFIGWLGGGVFLGRWHYKRYQGKCQQRLESQISTLQIRRKLKNGEGTRSTPEGDIA